MAKFSALILLIILLVFNNSFSQGGGYYVSGLDLPRSQSPEKDMENNFIYRISNGGENSFYLVKINDLMLKEKSLYRWPIDYDEKLKSTTKISEDAKGQNEILDFIYNEKLVLTESKNAFIKAKNTFIKLEKVDYVGVSLIGSEKQFFYVPKSSGDYEVKRGPLFQYSIKGVSNYVLIGENGKVTRWILPDAKPREYRVLNPVLENLMSLPPLVKIPEYNTTMDEVKKSYEMQKELDLLWIDSIMKNLIAFPPRAEDESVNKFELRKEIHKVALDKMLKEVLPDGWQQNRYALYEQRLEVQKVVQEKSKIIDNLSIDKRQLLVEQWWQNRLSIRSRTLIAGQLEDDFYYEAPSALWGQDLFVDYTNRLFASVYWDLALGGGYTSWKVKQSATDDSYQIWYGLKVGLLIPIFIGANNSVAPYSGGGLSLRLGSISRNSQTQIKSDSPKEIQKLATGFYSALDFNFGESGFGFGIEYEYLSDHSGEIGLSLHLPIISWRN